jgi:hypothetical protein
MNGWNAFRTGLSRATRYRWVLLILFAVNLLTALLLAVLPALSLVGPGHRPAIRQAADGVDAWMVIETLMSPLTNAILEESAEPKPSPGLQQGILLALLTAALLPLLSWLPASFLTGGLLLTYAEAPQSFGWRRFLWGCWHWWGAFLLLGAVQGIVSFLLFAPLIAIAVGAIAVAGEWLTWVVIPLLALVAVLWLALMECTRVAAVVGETRNVARAFGGAVRFVCRHPLSVAALYGLALLLLALLHALYRCVMLYLPLDWWPLVLVVQQAFILARLWARLARLAGETALYRSGRLGIGKQVRCASFSVVSEFSAD